MTVYELYLLTKEMVESNQGNTKVVIPLSSKEASFGPSPTVEIKDYVHGFDWNSGKLFLQPQTPVTEFKHE